MRCSVHIIIALCVLLNIDTVHSSGDDNQDAVQSTQNTVRLMIGPESVQQQIQVTETAVREYSDLTNTNLVRKNGVLLKLESDETFTEPVELKVTTLIPFSVVVPNVSFQTTLKDIDLESMKVLTKPEFSSVGELAKEKCKSCQYTKIVFPEARTSEVTLQLPALNKKKLQDVYTSPAGLYMYLDDSYALLESLIIRNIPAIKTMTTVTACTFDEAERNVAGMKAFEHLRNLRKGKNSSQGILDWSVSSAKENPKDWTFTGLASGSSTTNKNFKYVTVQLETAAGIEIEKTVILGESSNSIYVASTKVGTQPEHNLYFLSGTLAAQDHAHSILVVLFYNNSLITRVFVYEVVMSTGTTSMTCYAVEKSSNMMCDFLFAFENDYRDPQVQLILTSSPDASSLGLVDFRLTSCLVPRERQRELRDVARFSKIVFFENQLSSEVSETDIANLSKTIESAKLRAEQQVKQRETNLTAKITNVSQKILDRSKLIKDAVEQAKKDNEEQETKKEKSQAEKMEGLRQLMKEAETRMEELRANKEKVNEQRNKIQNFLDEFQSFLDTKKEDIDNKPEVKDALSKAKEMQELQEKVEEEIKSQDQKKNEYSQSLKEIESFVQDFSSRIAASQTREKELEDIIKAHEGAIKPLPANTKWKGGLVFVALAFIATVIAFIVLLIVQPHMASRGLTSAPN